MSGWPARTLWPTSTRRSITLPGTRNPRLLWTRAEMTPVNARSDARAGLTVASWTSCGPWRGSFPPEAAGLMLIAAAEPRPTVAAKAAAERSTILVFFIDHLARAGGRPFKAERPSCRRQIGGYTPL